MIMRAEEHWCTQSNNTSMKMKKGDKMCHRFGARKKRHTSAPLVRCNAQDRRDGIQWGQLHFHQVGKKNFTPSSNKSRYNEICGNSIPRYFSASAKSSLALHSIPPKVASSNVGFRTIVLTGFDFKKQLLLFHVVKIFLGQDYPGQKVCSALSGG